MDGDDPFTRSIERTPPVTILGNAGSGKSTLARELAAEHALAALDLDTLAWEPGKIAVARDPERARADVDAFCAARRRWVVEGCYANLIEVALQHDAVFVLLETSIAACVAHCRERPWEPHKYANQEEQDTRLEELIAWVRAYDTREGELGRAAHEALYERYRGRKWRVTERAAGKERAREGGRSP